MAAWSRSHLERSTGFQATLDNSSKSLASFEVPRIKQLLQRRQIRRTKDQTAIVLRSRAGLSFVSLRNSRSVIIDSRNDPKRAQFWLPNHVDRKRSPSKMPNSPNIASKPRARMCVVLEFVSNLSETGTAAKASASR